MPQDRIRCVKRQWGPALARAPREAGDKSGAAPATVTGEPRSTTPLARVFGLSGKAGRR